MKMETVEQLMATGAAMSTEEIKGILALGTPGDSNGEHGVQAWTGPERLVTQS